MIAGEQNRREEENHVVGLSEWVDFLIIRCLFVFRERKDQLFLISDSELLK